jgi:hypothetical protein
MDYDWMLERNAGPERGGRSHWCGVAIFRGMCVSAIMNALLIEAQIRPLLF